MAMMDPSSGRGVVPYFVLPAKANRIQLLMLRSVGRIATVRLVLTLRSPQLITRSPGTLEPHIAESPLTALSKKGGAVRAVSAL